MTRTEDAILALPAPATAAAPPAWDRRSSLPGLAAITRRFGLGPDEKRLLERNGFAATARLAQPSYGWAYHEIYQSQLPMYVSIDSIFNAVYAANDRLIGQIEREELAPRLAAVLAALHCQLPLAAPKLPGDTAHDLDVYLVVARSLLGPAATDGNLSIGEARARGVGPPAAVPAGRGSPVGSIGEARARGVGTPAAVPAERGSSPVGSIGEARGNPGGVTSALGDPAVDREAARLIALAMDASEMSTVTLFGRERVIDFTQYQPRGHYNGGQEPYFRAVMWLSRLELNLVSRSSRSSAPRLDPSETPREDVDALALAELITTSGMLAEVERIERVLTLLGGRREDVPLTTVAQLAQRAGITDLRAPDAAARLRAAIGKQFARTARVHPMPEGSSELPAIATLLGPRIVPDTAALPLLLHSATEHRELMGSGDIAYILGADRGLAYLARDLAQFPDLRANLDAARATIAAAPRTGDLYTAWLDAIRALARPVDGVAPSFTRSEAFADLRYNTTVAAYAQLRHNYVLIAGEPYGEGGCEIPDSYLEPAPEVYDALAHYAELGAHALDDRRSPSAGGGSSQVHDYFVRLGKLARVFAQISRIELAGQPLPDEARRFLGMVSEIGPYGSDGLPTYTGWYFDLFLDRNDAIARADLIADYVTSPEGVGYLGVQSPVLAIFAVDTGGAPRAMIGPVARAYEHWSRGRRLDDQAAAALPAANKVAPWTGYLAAAPPRPPFRIGVDRGGDFVEITAKRPLGAMTIELLDHHRVAIRRLTRTIGAGTTRIRFDLSSGQSLPVLHFQIGLWHGWGELHCVDGCYLYERD